MFIGTLLPTPKNTTFLTSSCPMAAHSLTSERLPQSARGMEPGLDVRRAVEQLATCGQRACRLAELQKDLLSGGSIAGVLHWQARNKPSA